MICWYARFIEELASLELPLVKLLHKDVPWTWGQDQQNAFDCLKSALAETPVIAGSYFGRPFVIQTDASDSAIGAVLMQEVADGEHPIVFINRVLTTADKNLQLWRKNVWLYFGLLKSCGPISRELDHRNTFTMITDHSSL